MSKLKNGVPGSYQIITPPNLLRAKVTGSPGFDARTIERAESAIASHSGDFLGHAENSLKAMNEAVANAAADHSPAAKGRIFSAAFELKAMGGMFDYGLVSLIANNLCVYLEKLETLDKKTVEIAAAHCDAIRAVVANRLTGDGGPIGAQLFSSLNELTSRPRREAA